MPRTFRYTHPVPPRSATGRNAEVFAQIAAEFGIDRPTTFVVLSPVPELLAAAWALLRESLIAGAGSRTGRELVAAGVSMANRCPFCVGAHTLLLHATGDHALAERLARGERPADPAQDALLAWGEATRVPAAAGLAPPPFPSAEAPAQLGTALSFHFINRIVSALLSEQLLPCNAQRFRLVRSAAGRAVGPAVRRAYAPGRSLDLLDGPLDAGSAGKAPGGGPAWAAGDPAGTAYAALRSAAAAGAGLLDAEDLARVHAEVAAWDGSHLPLSWPGLPGRSRPGARLALLAALAPYRITDEDVAAWRGGGRTDAQLVRLVAYGAFAAVDRIERALPAALTSAGAAAPTAASTAVHIPGETT